MTKFDRQKTKHQLLHLSISLAAILFCMTYMQYQRNWMHIGSFGSSLLLPIIFVGELLKVISARYFSRIEYESPLQKKRQRKESLPREIIVGLIVQFLCTVLYSFVCIILGAPVLYKYEQTFVLSVLLTLLTVSPTVLLLGGNGALQACFCEHPEFLTKSDCTALTLFKYNAFGSILGAWAGSVVTPLDWDRDWQAYPIPNVVGALLGSALLNIYACSRVIYSTAKVYLNKKRI